MPMTKEKILELTKNCCCTLLFTQLPDLGIAFCVDTNEEGIMEGISVWGLRASRKQPFRLKSQLLTDIFQLKLEQGKNTNEMLLTMRPLTQKVRVYNKPSGFVALYPFKDHKKMGHVTHVQVSGQLRPLEMQFTIYGTYKSQQDSVPLIMTETIRAPNDFTAALYDMFENETHD